MWTGIFQQGGTFMKRTFVCVAAMLGVGLLIGTNEAQDKPKYTIKQVMQKAMAKKDYKTLDKAELVDLFTALAANKPPAGDADSWKKKTSALLAAAKEGPDAVGKAANCTACHSEHKGKKKA